MKRRYEATVYRSVAESTSDVKWLIYFPPYSIAEYAWLERRGFLDSFLAMKGYIVNTLKDIPGVTLYDFQRAPWITDLDSYADVRHHSYDYNRAILQALHDGEWRHSGQPHEYDDSLRLLIREFTDTFPCR